MGRTGRAAARTSRSVLPRSASTTPGRLTEPVTVNSEVPGSSAVPAERNQAAPCRATSATWARVSALRTSVGRPPTPDSVTRVNGSRGRAGRPSSWLTSAVSWPAMKPPSSWTTSTFRPRAAARAAVGSISGPTARTARLACIARARVSRPSSTRWGLRVSRTASLWLSGSPSMPLPTTTGFRAPAATERTLVAVGKPAPPRPVSPLSVTASRSSSRPSRTPPARLVPVRRAGDG